MVNMIHGLRKQQSQNLPRQDSENEEQHSGFGVGTEVGPLAFIGSGSVSKLCGWIASAI